MLKIFLLFMACFMLLFHLAGAGFLESIFLALVLGAMLLMLRLI